MRRPPLCFQCFLFVFAALAPLGCSLGRPTLRAVFVTGVPLPNAQVESDLWSEAPELHVTVRRGQGRLAETREVKLRAIHDGRALSILAQWVDDTQTFDRRAWAWDLVKQDYFLHESPIDQFAILWPLSKRASFCMLDGRDAVYDVWQWRTGWMDAGVYTESGYADDRRLILKTHPKGTRPDQVKGPLYRAGHGKMVEFNWVEDRGVPGQRPTEKPETRQKFRMPGFAVQEARGSAADVLARGFYNPKFRKETSQDSLHNTWRTHKNGDYWSVEFYRLLLTADAAEDYELRGRGPFPFAVAVWDNSAHGDHFTSGALRLVLAKTPNTPL